MNDLNLESSEICQTLAYLSEEVRREGRRCIIPSINIRKSKDIDVLIESRTSLSWGQFLKGIHLPIRISPNGNIFALVHVPENGVVAIHLNGTGWITDATIHELLTRAIEMRSGFFVPHANDQIVVSFLKAIRASDRYRKEALEEAYGKNTIEPRAFKERLELYCTTQNFRDEAAEVLLRAIEAGIPSIYELSALRDSLFNDPSTVTSWPGGSRFKLRKLKQVRTRIRDLKRWIAGDPLFSVAFIGVDGAGKSTLIDNLEGSLGRMLPLSVCTMKEKEPITGIGRFFSSRSGVWRKFHRRVYGAAYISVLVDWLDKLIRQQKVVRAAARDQGIAIFDRWSFDTIVAAKRAGIAPRILKFSCFLERVIPKPDAFIFVDVSVEVARARKQENTEDDLEFRISHYREHYCGYKQTVVVDGNRSGIEVLEEVEGLILRKILKKQKR